MLSKTDTETATVIHKARAGDNAARETIIKRFHDRIFRLVFYRVKNRSDAEDITQEIFIKVLNNLSKLKNPRRLKPWIYTIAINQVNDFHKKKMLLSFFEIGRASCRERV
jgi:RNA polymerase sigma factor (sigma-70 family)